MVLSVSSTIVCDRLLFSEIKVLQNDICDIVKLLKLYLSYLNKKKEIFE